LQFGLRARDEALHLAVLSEQMRARWNTQLCWQAAREIETNFAEARRRLDVEGAPEATDGTFWSLNITNRAVGDARPPTGSIAAPNVDGAAHPCQVCQPPGG
jgi:hypothetical protein